jgi:hypothetical protein
MVTDSHHSNASGVPLPQEAWSGTRASRVLVPQSAVHVTPDWVFGTHTPYYAVLRQVIELRAEPADYVFKNSIGDPIDQ